MRLLAEIWPYILAALIPVVQATAAAHVILRKRNVRAAVGWVGLIWLAPVVGVVAYAGLGVNRIQRKARTLRTQGGGYREWISGTAVDRGVLRGRVADDGGYLADLATLGDRVSGRPLLGGNRVLPLEEGDRAYPAMLDAIAGATTRSRSRWRRWRPAPFS